MNPQLTNLAVLVLLAGCRAPINDANDLTPAPAATTEQRASVPTFSGTPPSEEGVPEEGGRCEHPITVSPEAVARAIPSWVGKCVRFPGRVVRSLDMTRALVRAGAQSFVVWLDPNATWSGARARNFIVMGTTVVPDHGRTMLPELQVVDDASTSAE